MAVNWKGPPETTHSVPRELEARLLMSVEGAWIGGAGHAFSMLAQHGFWRPGAGQSLRCGGRETGQGPSCFSLHGRQKMLSLDRFE
jgi:hypothetical protein